MGVPGETFSTCLPKWPNSPKYRIESWRGRAAVTNVAGPTAAGRMISWCEAMLDVRILGHVRVAASVRSDRTYSPSLLSSIFSVGNRALSRRAFAGRLDAHRSRAMASDFRLKEQLPSLTNRIVATYSEVGSINHLGHCPLPQYEAVVEILEDLKEILYPGYRRRVGLHSGNVTYHAGDLIDGLHDKLTMQIGRALAT